MRSNTHSIFLVKRVGKHTPEHTFLLHAVYEEIMRYTAKVRTDETARTDGINPDVLFTNEKGEEIALEIETGSNLKHHPEYIKEKVKQLDQKYPNRWHFILTSNDQRRHYTYAFGRFVLLRHHIPRFVKRHFSSREVQDNVTTLRQSPNIDDKKSVTGGAKTVHGGEKQGVQQ